MDLVGPAGAGLAPALDPLFDRIAAEASDVDAYGVRRQTLDELAAHGLLGTALAPVSAQRELTERLAMVDASTWFCWAQHQTPLKVLSGEASGIETQASDSLRIRYLDGLQSGVQLAAVAFAHIRRPGAPNPLAVRVDGGWRFDGTLDWITSWDIADVVMVMAQGAGPDSGSLVCAFLPAGRADQTLRGFSVGDPLRLLAMSGTHTRPARLDAVAVADDDVVIVDRAAWLDADASTTANANPAAFGLARGAIAELADLADQRGDSQMRELADELADQVRSVRAAAYRAADDVAPLDERVALRARSLDVALQAATSVVTARAGAAMATGSSAERRYREAAFLQVQAQTAVTRAASLDLLLNRAR